MKTFITLKQNFLKSTLVILLSASCMFTNASSSIFVELPKSPVTFTAVLNNNNKVDFKWSTETETNLSHFMVERSTDGINFSDAALVFAYGNTTSKADYAFAISIGNKKPGTVYYRLCTINGDGTAEYSETLVIKISK